MLEKPPNATHGCTLELGEWLTLEPADARAHSSPSSWPFTFASQHRRHANRRFSVNPKSRRCRSSDRIYALSSVARIAVAPQDRKSTRLNSSHGYISYAVFCLKKKKIALTCYASVSTE